MQGTTPAFTRKNYSKFSHNFQTFFLVLPGLIASLYIPRTYNVLIQLTAGSVVHIPCQLSDIMSTLPGKPPDRTPEMHWALVVETDGVRNIFSGLLGAESRIRINRIVKIEKVLVRFYQTFNEFHQFQKRLNILISFASISLEMNLSFYLMLKYNFNKCIYLFSVWNFLKCLTLYCLSRSLSLFPFIDMKF